LTPEVCNPTSRRLKYANLLGWLTQYILVIHLYSRVGLHSQRLPWNPEKCKARFETYGNKVYLNIKITFKEKCWTISKPYPWRLFNILKRKSWFWQIFRKLLLKEFSRAAYWSKEICSMLETLEPSWNI